MTWRWSSPVLFYLWRRLKGRKRLSDVTKFLELVTEWESGTLENHSSGLSIKTWVMVFPFNWPGVLQAMGSHRDGHDWVTELKWTELSWRVFPGGSDTKESACSAGDVGLITGLGRSLGEGNVNPLQYSCLEIPMDIGAWGYGPCGLEKVGHDWATEWQLFRVTKAKTMGTPGGNVTKNVFFQDEVQLTNNKPHICKVINLTTSDRWIDKWNHYTIKIRTISITPKVSLYQFIIPFLMPLSR